MYEEMWAENTLCEFRLNTCKWGRVLNDRHVKWEVVELKESEHVTWVQDQEKVHHPSILS